MFVQQTFGSAEVVQQVVIGQELVYVPGFPAFEVSTVYITINTVFKDPKLYNNS